MSDIETQLSLAREEIRVLHSENERLKEGLIFYANPRNYRWLGAYESEVVEDGGGRARAALSPGEAREEGGES